MHADVIVLQRSGKITISQSRKPKSIILTKDLFWFCLCLCLVFVYTKYVWQTIWVALFIWFLGSSCVGLSLMQSVNLIPFVSGYVLWAAVASVELLGANQCGCILQSLKMHRAPLCSYFWLRVDFYTSWYTAFLQMCKEHWPITLEASRVHKQHTHTFKPNKNNY